MPGVNMHQKKYKPTVAFVFSRTLGNKIVCDRIKHIASSMDDITPLFINIEEDEIYSIDTPYLFRRSIALLTYYIAKSKLEKINHDSTVDAFFVVTAQPILAMKRKNMKKNIALCLDATSMNTFIRDMNPDKGIKDLCMQRVINKIYKRRFNKVDYFLPMSMWCANSLVNDYRIQKEKISVCYSGIDLDKWSPPDRKEDNNEFRILFVGNDLPIKGILDFLKYYEGKELNNVHFNIISKDNSDLFEKSYISVIHDITHNNLDRLIEFYRRSDMFLFPTKSDMLAHVLIEASATGLPIIATEIAGIPEVVENGMNGFLIERGNWSQFYEKIHYLKDNRAERLRMGCKSRKIALDKFSYKNFQDKIIKTINLISAG
jgi:glycosyltransferase involved in cell wall biosynthesis